jgi:hypothetical protein
MEKKENKFIKSILINLEKIFKKNKDIDYILVKKRTQRFYVKDPKKIKFWMKMAETSAKPLLFLDDQKDPSIKILKVFYKNG